MGSYLRTPHTLPPSTPPRTVDTSGMARAEQETLTVYLSSNHLLQQSVSVSRYSDTGCCATDTAADRPDAAADEEKLSSSEDEDDTGTPTEEANEPGHSSNPPDRDTLQLLVDSPPNQTDGQTASSSKEELFHKVPSQPLVDEDCDAAKVNSEAETNPANLTARKAKDIQGTSKAPQHGQSTVTAKQTPTANQQSSSTSDPMSEKTIKRQLGVPLNEPMEKPPEAKEEEKPETREEAPEAQVEEKPETPTDTPTEAREEVLEAQVEEELSTPTEESLEAQMEGAPAMPTDTPPEAQVEEELETPTEAPPVAQMEEILEMPIEETLETPTEETFDHNQQLLFPDVAVISNLPIMYCTRRPSTNSVAYTQCNVEINPTDRHV